MKNGINKYRCRISAAVKAAKKVFRSGNCFLSRHAGKIAYYVCVAVVLSAVAYAADCYRQDEAVPTDALILPKAQMQAEEEVQIPALRRPEGWQILKGHNEEMEWNRELMQWQSHPATDYICPDNIVCSLSEGTVRTIGKSGVYGGFIEIETQDYLIRYASVQPEPDLSCGMSVKAGEQIAQADANMPGEIYLGEHVHLELQKKGVNMDLINELEKISA